MQIAATVIVTGLLTIAFAVFVFRPITGPALETATNFRLSDVFSLVVLWQYPLALIQLLRSVSSVTNPPETGAYVLGGILLMVLTALWLGLTTTLSQRGVYGGVQRFIVIAVAMPLAIVATLALFPTATVAIVVNVLKPRREWDAWPAGIAFGCFAVGLLCRGALVWALRTGSNAVLNETQQQPD